MLQRTPTWYGIRPAKDAIANFLRKILPEELAYKITRFKNVRIQNMVFKRARTKPQQVKDFLTKRIKQALGDKYDAKTFTPPYDPWDQRLCLVPDGDLFTAINAGKASIVTDHIDRFDATGIKLKSGKHLDADVIITATGLKMVMAGKIALSADGSPLDFADHYYYKGAMFSNVPNLAAVFGYLNASWTLRADINARFICDILNKMKADGTQIAVPKLAPNHHLDEDNIYDFSSGYIERARHLLPKSATDMRWRLNQDYIRDKAWMQSDPLDDGVLQFGQPRTAARPKEQFETAQ
jgi:cation diffusion facilitator CzcD-associated flavoprotein CzcO